MRWPLIGALLALLACSGGDPLELVGEYNRQKRVFVFHGNEPEESEVEDLLTLTSADGSELWVTLRIIGNDGKGCTLEGPLRPMGDRLEYHSESAPECRLEIRQVDGGIEVEDIEDACRLSHCTGSASIGRATFRPEGER